MSSDPYQFPAPGDERGLAYPGVIDLLTHAANSEVVDLVMFESRPWDGGDEQLFELQEKLNAYLSFALDGEMAETYPQLEGKSLRIILRCLEAPPEEAVEFLSQVREQISLQGIDLEVRFAEENPGLPRGVQPVNRNNGGGSCGSGGCGCHHG